MLKIFKVDFRRDSFLESRAFLLTINPGIMISVDCPRPVQSHDATGHFCKGVLKMIYST